MDIGLSFQTKKNNEFTLSGKVNETNEELTKRAEEYNKSKRALKDSERLKKRITKNFGDRNWYPDDISTKVNTERYGLDKKSNAVNIKAKKRYIVGGYYDRSTKKLVVSPFVTRYYKDGGLLFRAVAGHELIHAFHHNQYGDNYSKKLSEDIAYRYSYDVFYDAGYTEQAYNLAKTASKRGFWIPKHQNWYTKPKGF